MKIKLFFAWYDIWVGFYWDKKSSVLYFCPLPCIVFKISGFKPLGILFYQEKVVNHRSFLKILLNPILMIFGIMVASNFDNNKFLNYTIIKCEKSRNIFKNFYSHIFTCNDYDTVEKKKMFI